VRLAADDFATQVGWAPGQRLLGRFTLEALIGRGGMGVVWRARDETLGEVVALKFLPETVARDEVAIDELKEETRRARRLTHPNIVRIHDFVQGDGLAAIAMEFIDGDTLARLRLDQPGKVFSVAALAPLAAQLCAALDYAHLEAKVAHRDLKPANMLVTRDGQLKVADFGIARSLTETNTRLTGRAGRTSGTLLYVSPQQLAGDKPSATDDIYALGTSLYELLTGKPPFYRGDANSLILQVREKAPLSLAAQRAELELTGEPIPANWEKTIQACLAKNPKDRPQSAGEVAVRLGLAAPGVSLARGSVSAKPEPGSKRMGWPLIGAVAAAALAGLGYFLWPRPVAPIVAAVPARAAAVLPREFVVTIDPPAAGAVLSLGPQSEIEVKAGRAVVKDLPDGEHDLVVKALRYQPSATRVTVKAGRGTAEVKLVAERGTLELTARAGTVIALVDAAGKNVLSTTVGPSGELAVAEKLPAGIYTLRAEHSDYGPVERTNVEIAGGKATKLALDQVALPGELRVFSVPAEAEVRVNGKLTGQTPATLKNQPSATPLRVQVSLRGYRDFEQSVTLQPKEVRTLNVGTLAAVAGGIDLAVSVPDFQIERARVRIDGREIRPVRTETGWSLDGLEAGRRTVEIDYPDYVPWRRTVTVEDRAMAKVDVRLVLRPAILTLAVAGSADFTLLAGGRGVAVKDGKAELAPGEVVALEVRAPNFKTARRTLALKPGAAESWEVTLEKAEPARPGQPWENSLGMKFAPVPGTAVLFSIWDTRVQDYQAFVDETHQTWQKPRERGPAYPATASWTEAKAFCAWLTEKERREGRLKPDQGYRLPTDAEWSAAVGLAQETGATPHNKKKNGSATRVYPWGGQWPPPKGAGNFSDETAKNAQSTDGRKGFVDGYEDGFVYASPVGSFAPNKFGLFDMAGNVAQWCEDFYNPATDLHRVTRGGSFKSYLPEELLSSARESADPTRGYSDRGFRCVFDFHLPPAPATIATTVESAVRSDGGKPDRQFENSLGMNFVAVPGVAALVSIWDTRVQDYEVFANATGRKWRGRSWQEPTHPAVGVSWNEARAFCVWLTATERLAGRLALNQRYRLPTDAEWSIAAGLGDEGPGTPEEKSGRNHSVFLWGSAWPPPAQAGNFADETAREKYPDRGHFIAGYTDGFADTSPVGAFPANRFGLYDMAGNVWQWCEDELHPGSGTRVLRGGSFAHGDRASLAVSSRYDGSGKSLPKPDAEGTSWGFRCMLETSSAVAPVGGTDKTDGDASIPSVSLTATKAGPAPSAVASKQPVAAANRIFENTLGMKFVPVPGTDVMFSIWDTRVQDYAKFVDETQRRWNLPPFAQGPTHPVVNVTWDDAEAFCAWLTPKDREAGKLSPTQHYRLPTDAEWSVAVGLDEPREGTPQSKNERIPNVFPWGTAWPPPAGVGNVGNQLNVDSFFYSSPVGSFPANRFGLYDMSGNVWQWCEDFFNGRSGGHALRGGCFQNNEAKFLQSSHRNTAFSPTDPRNVSVGFRVVVAGDAAAASPVASAGDQRRDLVMYFSFDQPPVGGMVHDESGAGHDGRVVNATWVAEGRHGGALRFARANSYVSVSNDPALNPPQITVTAWVKTSYSDAVWRRIVDKGYSAGFAMSIGGETKGQEFHGRPVFEINRHATLGDANLRVDDGNWHHLAGTFDGAAMSFYVDGVLQARRLHFPDRIEANAFDLTIAGNRSTAGGNEVGASLDGLIDEVMIFNRALSAAEIRALLDGAK